MIFLGEWLNGRVVVSKTIGCVFESRLPCQNKTEFLFGLIFFCRGMDAYSTSKRKFLARLRLTRKSLYANITLVTSLFRRFAPYESRLIRILRISTLTYSTSKRKFLARLRLTRKSFPANNMLITSLFRRFAPYESRLIMIL